MVASYVQGRYYIFVTFNLGVLPVDDVTFRIIECRFYWNSLRQQLYCQDSQYSQAILHFNASKTAGCIIFIWVLDVTCFGHRMVSSNLSPIQIQYLGTAPVNLRHKDERSNVPVISLAPIAKQNRVMLKLLVGNIYRCYGNTFLDKLFHKKLCYY